MSETSKQDQTERKVVADDDWKSRVKEEDAKRDAEFSGAHPPATEAADANEDEPDIDMSALPEASMLTLIQMLSSQSILGLGLMPGPNGKTTHNLPLAKHFIDLLGVLQAKCKGNLTGNESDFLDGTLHELRMAYVAVSKSQPAK